jgi:hypothetical protein
MTCQSPNDTLPACGDAGGKCYFGETTCDPKRPGPPNACAYNDEICCLQ